MRRGIVSVAIIAALGGCRGYTDRDVEPFQPGLEYAVEPAPPLGGLGLRDALSRDARRAELAKGLSLAEAEKIALEMNPTLGQALHAVDAAKARIREASVFTNPVFTVSKSEVASSDNDTNNDLHPEVVHGWDFAGGATTFTFSKDFDLNGKRYARVDNAIQNERQTEAQYASTAAQLRAQVRVAYAIVLVAQRNEGLAKEALEMARKNRQIVTQRAAGGNALPADGVKAESDESRAEIDSSVAVSAVARAKENLAALFSDPQAELGPLQGDLPLSLLPEKTDEDKLIGMGLARNPDVIAARRGVAAAGTNLTLQRRSAVPDLTVSAGWNEYFEDEAKIPNDIGGKTFTGSVSVPLPIFDRNQGQIAEADALRRQAEKALRATENATVLAIRDDLKVLKVSRERIDRFEKVILPKQREAVSLTEASYEGGKILYLDVITARQAFNQSRADYITELSTYEAAMADLERLLAITNESQFP